MNLNSTFAKSINLNLNFDFSKSMNLNLNLVFLKSMNLNLIFLKSMNLNLKIKKKNEWIQPWSQHEYDTECNGNLLKVCQTNSKNHAMI